MSYYPDTINGQVMFQKALHEAVAGYAGMSRAEMRELAEITRRASKLGANGDWAALTQELDALSEAGQEEAAEAFMQRLFASA